MVSPQRKAQTAKRRIRMVALLPVREEFGRPTPLRTVSHSDSSRGRGKRKQRWQRGHCESTSWSLVSKTECESRSDIASVSGQWKLGTWTTITSQFQWKELNTKVAKEAKGFQREPFASLAIFVFKIQSGSCFGPAPYRQTSESMGTRSLAARLRLGGQHHALDFRQLFLGVHAHRLGDFHAFGGEDRLALLTENLGTVGQVELALAVVRANLGEGSE